MFNKKCPLLLAWFLTIPCLGVPPDHLVVTIDERPSLAKAHFQIKLIYFNAELISKIITDRWHPLQIPTSQGKRKKIVPHTHEPIDPTPFNHPHAVSSPAKSEVFSDLGEEMQPRAPTSSSKPPERAQQAYRPEGNEFAPDNDYVPMEIMQMIAAFSGENNAWIAFQIPIPRSVLAELRNLLIPKNAPVLNFLDKFPSELKSDYITAKKDLEKIFSDIAATNPDYFKKVSDDLIPDFQKLDPKVLEDIQNKTNHIYRITKSIYGHIKDAHTVQNTHASALDQITDLLIDTGGLLAKATLDFAMTQFFAAVQREANQFTHPEFSAARHNFIVSAIAAPAMTLSLPLAIHYDNWTGWGIFTPIAAITSYPSLMLLYRTYALWVQYNIELPLNNKHILLLVGLFLDKYANDINYNE